MRITARPFLAMTIACALLGSACDDAKPAAGVGAPGSTSANALAPSARPSAQSGQPAKPAATVNAEAVELLKFSLTSAVKDKEPADKLDSAKPGQRVYAHLAVRNRTSGSKRVSVSFRVNGDERTMVDLDVEKSWSWRTWAYVTLRKDDKGEITVHVFDDHGAELGTESIPIR